MAGNLIGPEPGEIVSIVIAQGTSSCTAVQSSKLGVVFYNRTPKIWTCLSDAELTRFHTWCTQNFPNAKVRDVTAPLPTLNCPPSIVSAAEHAAADAALGGELASLGPTWLAALAA
ncbi:MAG TPA: hypothetical protein VK607_14625 [Kofleriaceae bacterium]|nr:hypothetical protein [Kofleriaceae bacterium]